MFCPFCQAEDTKVVDSRLVADGSQIRRRRECEVWRFSPQHFAQSLKTTWWHQSSFVSIKLRNANHLSLSNSLVIAEINWSLKQNGIAPTDPFYHNEGYYYDTMRVSYDKP